MCYQSTLFASMYLWIMFPPPSVFVFRCKTYMTGSTSPVCASCLVLFCQLCSQEDHFAVVPRICEQAEHLLLSMTGMADAARHASMCEMKLLPPILGFDGDAQKLSFQSLLQSSSCVVMEGHLDAGNAQNCLKQKGGCLQRTMHNKTLPSRFRWHLYPTRASCAVSKEL